MATKTKFNPAEADRYRLRMICLQWYLMLYKGTQRLGALGPFDHKGAEACAADLVDTFSLKDWDKMA